MTRIAIIVGNPKRGSYSRALGEAYREGAAEAGHEARLFDLSEMTFDPILRDGFAAEAPLEPDLLEAQAAIGRAEHVVWIWPLWLGFPPALLKGFLERVLRLGFAIEPDGKGRGFRPLLGGRSARIVVTMAMPALMYRFVAGARSVRTFRFNVLEFVGMKPVRVTLFGMTDWIGEAKRRKRLERMRDLGRRGA